MKSVNELHDEAMDLAQFGVLERSRGNPSRAAELFEQALAKELAAIADLESLPEKLEPTYSVLHRSAGTLALDCNNLRLAEQLAAKALAQDPPSEVAEELRDLLEQVYFQRHLEVRGIELGIDEMQMSLAGPAVGYGVVSGNEFFQRINDSSKLIYRIIERRTNRPFRERGRPARDVESNNQLFLSVPRAASFAVTLKLGHAAHQPPFPTMTDTSGVLHEFMELMDLVNRLALDEIERRVPDPAYRLNLMALSKGIAPDGERIRQVGFTVADERGPKSVQIIRPRAEFTSSIQPATRGDAARSVRLRGTLRYADATNANRNRIRIIDETGQSHTVNVGQGMMSDIVQPMWDSEVWIEGQYGRGRGRGSNIIYLDNIERVDPSDVVVDDRRIRWPSITGTSDQPRLIL